MKKKITLLLIMSLMLLSFAACKNTDKQEKTTEYSSQENAEEKTGEKTGENSTEEGTESTEEEKPAHKVTLQIDGYDAKSYPGLDGSLANVPLLTRMMSDLTGADEETAESYMSGSFMNGGTSTSWGRLARKEGADLIISYEPPEEVKEEMLLDMEKLEIDPLGRDGLVFIVNRNNPVDSLTVDQIRDIYTGKITDWSQVGGPAGKITAYQRNSTSGSQTLLQKLVLKDAKAMEPEKDLLVDTMGGLIESVADFDGSDMAIGFSVYYYADRMKSNPSLKMLKVEGVTPENASIEDGTYPLVNDFFMAIRAEESESSPVRALRDWMLTENGRTLLEEEGYVWARNGLPEESRGKGNIFR